MLRLVLALPQKINEFELLEFIIDVYVNPWELSVIQKVDQKIKRWLYVVPPRRRVSMTLIERGKEGVAFEHVQLFLDNMLVFVVVQARR